MASLPSRRVWTCSALPLEWRSWEDQNVVFNEASGDTHVLDGVAREALMSLRERAQSAAELTAEMARRLDVSADDTLREYVDRLLGQFDELGLVETIDA